MTSAIILNSDERSIEKTLKSLNWCDEVIVWKKPVNGDWAKARNEALKTAKNEWVLFVDSDETINKFQIPNDGKDGYFIRRRDIFWGRELKFGEAGKTKLLRLGKKGAGKWERKVHEFWNINNTGEINACIMHYPHQTVKEFINKINLYTDIDAHELLKEGKKFSYFRLFANPIGKFMQNYFIYLGLLDGWAGFTYAFMMSLNSLIVRVKLHEIDN